MKRLTPKPTQIILTVLLVGLISLACNLLQYPVLAPASKTSGTPQLAPNASAPAGQNTPASKTSGTPQPVPNASAPAGQNTPTADTSQADMTQPDPLDHLLALHSIQIDLAITRPDGSKRSLHVDTDASGNMDIKLVESLPDAGGMPKGFDPKALITEPKLLVLDGKAYGPHSRDPNWMSTPMDEHFLQTFAQELHGMDGPALWLNLLPDGSIQPAGQETVGGFAVDKYVVNGKVDNQVISGTLWEEPQSDALIQAELHVPGALLSDPDQPQPGELKIVLKAQKADVPAITLPPAPTGTAQTTATP